jgi:hypothetical protein
LVTNQNFHESFSAIFPMRVTSRPACMGGMMRRHVYQRPATTPTPEPHEYWLSRYYGGAQDITSTRSNHRRRNRSAASKLIL